MWVIVELSLPKKGRQYDSLIKKDPTLGKAQGQLRRLNNNAGNIIYTLTFGFWITDTE